MLAKVKFYLLVLAFRVVNQVQSAVNPLLALLPHQLVLSLQSAPLLG